MTVAEETNSTHIFTAMPSPDKQGQLSVKKNNAKGRSGNKNVKEEQDKLFPSLPAGSTIWKKNFIMKLLNSKEQSLIHK